MTARNTSRIVNRFGTSSTHSATRASGFGSAGLRSFSARSCSLALGGAIVPQHRVPRRGFWVGLLSLPALLSLHLVIAAAGPAGAETLSGGDIQVRGGSLAPAASAALSSASGTLHLEGSALGTLGAGHSSGISGMQLHVGVAPVPEPSAPWQLGAGVLGLGALLRRRRCSRG